MTIHKLLCLLTLAALCSCGESLEDTYKQYAGDGEVRRVGKVTDLLATPGWQRIRLSWENSTDPIITQVKVRWSSDETADSALLPVGSKEYTIDNLTTGTNYEVTVSSLDAEQHASMPSTAYVRPYNSDHEAVQAFTRVVSRSFFLHGHLLMTFAGWDPNIKDAYISFTSLSTGQQRRFDLTEEVVASLHVDVPDVDPSKPVAVHREGYIEGCPDLISFDPIDMDTDPVFNTEFKQEAKRQFGFDDAIPEQWRNSVEELTMDWSISDLADLLYLPKLKKLYLGQGRYVRPDMVDDDKAQSNVTDTELTDWVLDRLHELNGLEVYRYDQHFSTLDAAPWIHDMGHHDEPAVKVIALKGATVNVSPEESEELTQIGWSPHSEQLVDGDEASSWMPYVRERSTTFTVTITLPQAVHAKGVRLVQSYYPNAEATSRARCVDKVKISKSENGAYYTLATNLENTKIGASTGEVNYIPFAQPSMVKNLRIEVTTPAYFTQFQVSLAEIGLYD